MPTSSAPLTYHYLTHHIVPGPQSLSYFVPLLLRPIALLIPRSVLSRWQIVVFCMPVILSSTVHAWWQMGGVDVISVDMLLWALLLLVLRDPWEDFRRVSGKEGDGEKTRSGKEAEMETSTGLPAVNDDGAVSEQSPLVKPVDSQVDPKAAANKDPAGTESPLNGQPYPQSFWPRLSWVGNLLVSIRLNTWTIGSPSHDRKQPPPPAFASRTAFARYAIVCFIRGYLTLDLTSAYISHDPYFTNASVSIRSPLPFSSLQLAPPQLLRSIIVGAQAWAIISQLFYIACLPPVGLHAFGWLGDDWSPHLWPPYFGSPRVIFMHGVRGFWGQYWHQTMRWSVSGPGYAIADALRLKAGGIPRYAMISIMAFGLSGIVHMGLVPPEPLYATMHVNNIRLCVAGFFWLQPAAMVVEILVSQLVRRMTGWQYWQKGLGVRMRMLINGLWVVAWFTLALPLLGEAGRQLGYWRVWPVPVSLWKGSRGEGWVAWPILMKDGG